MKKIITISLIALLVISFVPVLKSNTSVVTAANDTSVEGYVITASGKGTVMVLPDIAYIDVGVITENLELEVAQKEAKDKMNKVIETLKGKNIADTDIKTTVYNVSPKYVWDERTRDNNVVGYTISNQVRVKIRETNKLGEILDTIITPEGSNTVSNIQFALEDDKDLYNQALELATKDAKQKALSLGKEFNIDKLKPLRITETSSRTTAYNNVKTDSLLSNSREMTPVSTGEMEITASVVIEFKY